MDRKWIGHGAKLLIPFAIVFIFVLTLCACSTDETAQIEAMQNGPETSPAESNDSDLLFEFIQNGNTSFDPIKLTDSFVCEELYAVFREYGAKYYECTWDYEQDGERTPAMATFIIKNNQTYYIYLSKIEGCYETDIDHDGENEVVCYANWGSGISHDCYYLLDKHDDAIILGILSVYGIL